MNEIRLGWAVSGNGYASRSVVMAHEAGLLDTTVCLYLTDRPSPISEFAAHRGIPVVEITPKMPEFDDKIIEVVATHHIEWLGLTFNRLLSSKVIDAMRNQIFNIHMALLPAFPGFDPI